MYVCMYVFMHVSMYECMHLSCAKTLGHPIIESVRVTSDTFGLCLNLFENGSLA